MAGSLKKSSCVLPEKMSQVARWVRIKNVAAAAVYLARLEIIASLPFMNFLACWREVL